MSTANALIDKLAILNVRVFTAAGDVVMVNEGVLIVKKASGAATQVTLPPHPEAGDHVVIKDGKGDAATNNITIVGAAAATVDGASSLVLSENYGAVVLEYSGAEWGVVGQTNAISAAELGFLNGVTAGTGLASKALVLDSSGNATIPTGGKVALSRATIAAAGTDSTGATALTGQFNLVTASDGAKGVALPAAATTTGPIWVVNTVGTAALFVYPIDGGNDNINGLAEDLALEVGPGESVVFVPTSATQWYANVSHNRFNAEVVTATNVLTVFESGKTFFLNSATEFVTTLPAVSISAGVSYTFIAKAAPSGASYTIITGNTSENKIIGHILSSQDAGGSGDSETSGGDTISFVDGKAVVGDRVDVVCDGAFWYARCSCKVFDGITITTAS